MYKKGQNCTRLLYLMALCCLGWPALLAQKVPIQWGQVPAEQWAITHCPFDSSALAVILADFGVVEVVAKSERVVYKRHIRLKILSKKALGLATRTIPYYSGQGIERIISIKAQTLNQGTSGKTEVKKVKPAEVFDVKLSQQTAERRFTCPAVQVGSIIEYRFVMELKNLLFLKTWDFQGPLPVLYSELRLVVPSGMEYMAIAQGNRLAEQYTAAERKEWVLTNLPALKAEPWAPPWQNHSERLRFQLKSYPQSAFSLSKQPVPQRLMPSWHALANALVNNYNYQRYLNNSRLAANLLLRMPERLQGRERLTWVYQAVQANFDWNQAYSLFTEQPLQQLLATRQGNGTELNLLLCLLLHKAGFKALPAIASTRQNGHVVSQYPLLNQFNHLVAYVLYNEQELLLDATPPYLTINQPSPTILGDSVLVLQGDSTGWVPTTQPPPTCIDWHAQIILGKNGTAQYNITLQANGYLATELYQLLGQKRVVGHPVVAPALMADADARLTFEVLRKNGLVVMANISLKNEQSQPHGRPALLLQPWLPLTGYLPNPFISPYRKLPVQWPYPVNYTYHLTVEPPPGYVPATLADSIHIALPHKYGGYQYNARWNGQQLVLTIHYQLNGLGMASKYYPQWRAFYETLCTRFAETVAFKLQKQPTASQPEK